MSLGLVYVYFFVTDLQLLLIFMYIIKYLNVVFKILKDDSILFTSTSFNFFKFSFVGEKECLFLSLNLSDLTEIDFIALYKVGI